MESPTVATLDDGEHDDITNYNNEIADKMITDDTEVQKFWMRERKDCEWVMALLEKRRQPNARPDARWPVMPLFSQRNRRWLFDVKTYTIAIFDQSVVKDTPCLCYNDKMVVSFADWPSVVQETIRREAFRSSSTALEYFIKYYHVGHVRNGPTIGYLRQLISRFYRPPLLCVEFHPATVTLPQASEVLRFSFPNSSAARDAILFITHKYKFQVVLKYTSYSPLYNALIHTYRCARYRTPHKPLLKEVQKEVHVVAAGKPSEKINSFLTTYDLEKRDQYNGARGVGCRLGLRIFEILDNSERNVVEIRGSHSGHDPSLETETFRAVHPTLYNVVRFMASTNLPVFHLHNKLVPFVEKYKEDRDADMRYYEQYGEFTRERTTLVGKTRVYSPLRVARAYSSKLPISDSDLFRTHDPAIMDFMNRFIGEKLLNAYRNSNILSPSDIFETDVGADSDSDSDSDVESDSHSHSNGNSSCEDDEIADVDDDDMWAKIKRPHGECSEDDWATFTQKLYRATSLHERGDRKYVPNKYITLLTTHPRIFSNYNFTITKEWLYAFNRVRRRRARLGRNARDDVLHVLEEYKNKGWADVKIRRDGKRIKELVVFIQTPLQALWCKERIGLTDVIQFDDTQNLTVWDMPYFVFLATDPQTMAEIPVAQGFVIYETKERYSKTNCIRWLFEQWDRRGNPPIQTFMFDRDQSSFIACRILAVQHFIDDWHTICSTYGKDRLKYMSAIVPKSQKDAARTFLMSLRRPDNLPPEVSSHLDADDDVEIPQEDIVPDAFPWISSTDADVILPMCSSLMPWIAQKRELVPGVIAFFIEECLKLHDAVHRDVGPESKLSWANWECKASLLRMLFSNAFVLQTPCSTLMKRSICVRARLCLFHVKKAWAEQLFQKVGSVVPGAWKNMYEDLNKLLYTDSRQAFFKEWDEIKNKWTDIPRGIDAIHYFEKSWLTFDWLYLWPSFARRFSNFCRNTNNGVESYFYQIKYALFGGRRPIDFRFALEQLIGSPNVVDSERRSFTYAKYKRLEHISSGSINHAKTNDVTRRAQRVVELLKAWGANMDLVKVIDPLRLVFRITRVEAVEKKDDIIDTEPYYFVCLANSVCTCPNRSMVCKHILALRQWSLTELELEAIWQDNELETVFPKDLCNRLAKRNEAINADVNNIASVEYDPVEESIQNSDLRHDEENLPLSEIARGSPPLLELPEDCSLLQDPEPIVVTSCNLIGRKTLKEERSRYHRMIKTVRRTYKKLTGQVLTRRDGPDGSGGTTQSQGGNGNITAENPGTCLGKKYLDCIEAMKKIMKDIEDSYRHATVEGQVKRIRSKRISHKSDGGYRKTKQLPFLIPKRGEPGRGKNHVNSSTNAKKSSACRYNIRELPALSTLDETPDIDDSVLHIEDAGMSGTLVCTSGTVAHSAHATPYESSRRRGGTAWLLAHERQVQGKGVGHSQVPEDPEVALTIPDETISRTKTTKFNNGNKTKRLKHTLNRREGTKRGREEADVDIHCTNMSSHTNDCILLTDSIKRNRLLVQNEDLDSGIICGDNM
jgi:hypothetical protein